MFALYNALVYLSIGGRTYYLSDYVSNVGGRHRAEMVKLDVLRLLEQKGKTKYWLFKQLNMSYQNFNHMVNNETKSIRYENIEAMCFLLDCTPSELFVFTQD